ncbi:MAG: cation-translocating P-type ATPase [Phycisphaerales bacterium]|nr:cation-translocating P-type ATPase [Phycisphaerales bacterium]MCI0676223.1 cation-translocating P-type ATPase [Phycisphaerales bacterium]
MSELTMAGAPDQDLKLREAGSEGAERLERRLFIALVGGVLLAASWISKWLGAHDQVSDIPAAIGAAMLVVPLLIGAWREVKRGRPSSDSLACLAVTAAFASQNYLAAGFLAFFLWTANLVLSRTAWGAQRAIRDLIDLTPDTARLIDNGIEREVGLAHIRIGQTVRVRPGENLPVDGRVIKGNSDINQASLTGEAVPIEAGPGTDVYAGTTNLTGQIDIEVTAVAGDTTIGKVESLIREAESAKTERQELIEELATYYVPVVLMVAGLVWFFTAKSGDPIIRGQAAERAITVLVVTCPGALLISHPTAMVAAFAAAARLGMMIKQTKTLEAAATIDTVVLDKTGTLTTGRFAVSRLAPAEGVEGAALLQAAADGEQHSNHPLAKSILETARQARISPKQIEKYEEVHGRGVVAHAPGGEIYAGRSDWLVSLDPSIGTAVASVESKIEGMSGVHVMVGGRYLGAVGLEDKLRRNAAEIVEKIRHLGVRKVCIFTGDRLAVAKRVGQAVGVDAIEAECLPEEKHEELKYLIKKGHRTLVVGDGINDGPILASADVGVAMGLSGSDIATNSAGVALMNDDLRHIPFLLELAHKARNIIAQNIAFSLILAIVGLALAATGYINIWFAPLLYVIGYVAVIFNSMRLVRFGEVFTETEEAKRRFEASRAVKPTRALVRPAAATS